MRCPKCGGPLHTYHPLWTFYCTTCKKFYRMPIRHKVKTLLLEVVGRIERIIYDPMIRKELRRRGIHA